MSTSLSGAIFIQIEQRPLCLRQCCQGETSVPGREHGSSPPYRVERGDRQEQITPTSWGGVRGMGDKKHEREKKRDHKQSRNLTTSILSRHLNNAMGAGASIGCL